MLTDAWNTNNHSLYTELETSMALRIAAVFSLLLLAGTESVPARSRDAMQRHEHDFAKQNTEPPHGGSIRVTFFGTSTLLPDDGETKFLIDGFITRPRFRELVLQRPLATDRTLVKNVLEHNGIDHLNAVFVSHSHYDHALDAAYIAMETRATLYGSPSTCNIGRGGGVKDMVCFCTDVKADYRVGPKFVVTVLPSKHSPPTLVNDE
ncbi:MAG: MBL fold metallo-hydrolase [Gammaproteobacteria bacterium]